MVDYHNPVTITREYCAFTFPPGDRSLHLPVVVVLRNSVACEALACSRWRIHVSLPDLPRFPSVYT